MACIDVTGQLTDGKRGTFVLWRSLARIFASQTDRYGDGPSRKPAGPAPDDKRARGYLADLDIAVGF